MGQLKIFKKASRNLKGKKTSTVSNIDTYQNETERQFKCVVVGDGESGKTSLLVRYVYGKYHDLYVPTVFETHEALIPVKEVNVRLTLWDTAGQEEYSRLRPLTYEGSDVILLCYSISNTASFNNLRIWLNEIGHFSPFTPIILVACKLDLRGDMFAVTKEEGKHFSEEFQIVEFLECSSLTGEGIENVFTTAANVVLKELEEKKKRVKGNECKLL